MSLMKSGRGREGPLGGMTLGLIGTWAQVEDGKGEHLGGVKQACLAQGTPLGGPTWEGSVDKQRWMAVGSAVQLEGCSATGREGGGGK